MTMMFLMMLWTRASRQGFLCVRLYVTHTPLPFRPSRPFALGANSACNNSNNNHHRHNVTESAISRIPTIQAGSVNHGPTKACTQSRTKRFNNITTHTAINKHPYCMHLVHIRYVLYQRHSFILCDPESAHICVLHTIRQL